MAVRRTPLPHGFAVATDRRDAVTPHGLRSRRFVTLLVVMALGVAGWMPLHTFMSLYVRDHLGAGLAGGAWVLLAIHGAKSTVGLLSGVWIRRLGSRWTYTTGLAGLGVLALGIAVTPNLAWLVALAPRAVC